LLLTREALLLELVLGWARLQPDILLAAHLFVPRPVHGDGAKPLDVGAHLVQVVRDDLVAIDRLAHAGPFGCVRARQAISRFAQADRLEAHAQARAVHQREHPLEALAALADEMSGRAFEAERRSDRSMVAELLLDAIEGDDALATAFCVLAVGRHQEHAQSCETGERIVEVGDLLGARDHEVVFAVARGDEDLLAGHVPIAVGVLFTDGLEACHVAASVGLGDVHASPGVAAPDLLDEVGEARLHDAAVLVDGARPLLHREEQHRHRHAAVKSVVRHRRHVGTREELGVHEVHEQRAVHAPELARQTHAVELELLDVLEHFVELGRAHRFAVHHLDAACIDGSRARRDFRGHELTDHRSDVAVERHCLGRVFEGVVCAEAALVQRHQRLPREAAIEVVLEVVVVVEVVGRHRDHSLWGLCSMRVRAGRRARVSSSSGALKRL
jgi:hypothetical protein